MKPYRCRVRSGRRVVKVIRSLCGRRNKSTARDMNRTRIIVGVCIAALLIASVAAAWMQPSAVDVARARCVSDGVRAEDLALLGFEATGTLFNRQQTVEFQVKGTQPPKVVRVELHQPAYFLNWRVVDV